jgi:hypothetical protein
MKKTVYSILAIAAIIVVASSSCETERFVNLPEHEPRLVVHGYVETGKPFSIAVGRSFRADIVTTLDTTYVKNATVVLYENGVFRDTLDYHVLQHRYVSASNVTPSPGNTYRLTVSAPGFDSVESIVTAPFPIPTTGFHYIRGSRISLDGTLMDDVVFQFNDPPGEENYYLARLETSGNIISNFCVFSYDPAVEKYQSDVNPFEANNCIDNYAIQFADRFFNGQSKEISVSGASVTLGGYTDPISGQVHRSYLTRFSVSKEFYQYVKSEIRLDLSSSDPFAQPVRIQGNIRNGYGMFAILAGVVDTLR